MAHILAAFTHKNCYQSCSAHIPPYGEQRMHPPTFLHNRLFLGAMLVLWICAVAVSMYIGLKPEPIPLEHPADKAVHIASCIVVMLLPAILVRQFSYLLASIAVLLLAGAGLEVYQSFLPGREASVGDLAADMAGIFLGVGVGRFLRRFYYKAHFQAKEK